MKNSRKSSQDPCPNCGYCSKCGRARMYGWWPTYPYPYTLTSPSTISITTGTTTLGSGTVTTGGANTTSWYYTGNVNNQGTATPSFFNTYSASTPGTYTPGTYTPGTCTCDDTSTDTESE